MVPGRYLSHSEDSKDNNLGKGDTETEDYKTTTISPGFPEAKRKDCFV